MTSVVIWRYRENKINLSFKGGGGCRWEGGPPSQDNGRGNTVYIYI